MIVAFAVNRRFFMPLAVAMHSLLKYNAAEIRKIYLFCNEISDDEKNKFRIITGDLDFEVKIIQERDLSQLVTSLHFQCANYYRLLIPDLLKEDKILYLDADIIVLGSLKPIWETDLTNDYLAAVWTPGVDWSPKLGVEKEDGYFNSGVMLMNLRQWRENNLGRKVVEFVHENPKLIRFVDQCGLNVMVKNRWKKLPVKYNLTMDFYEEEYEADDPGVDIEEIRKAKINPVIVHFTGSSKPWQTSNQHPFKFLFWKYLRQTPFSRKLPEDFNLVNLIKYLTPSKVRSVFRKLQYRFFPRGKFKLK
ncbi:MAG: glycosyltransferase family 8 protein [Mongoliibacter sp.]|uniref:glycosyltransferase family 8 protein n=1 Tax=Mongoliibacter sp. TaxID=2022438 RepID=UPI0012EF788C|nr:glycosyltransferase family 8 protein [Mongoliibacter sp.]TVP46546.1 MAG: glycosyltransferase family 8 protein [Mongoliibacter sp.]